MTTTKKTTFRTSEPSRRTTISRSFKRTYESISGKRAEPGRTPRFASSKTKKESRLRRS